MKFRNVENPKTAQLLIRVTPEEKRDIEGKAADCCMPVSAFVMKAVQGRQTRTRHHMNLIEELRLLGMELKNIYRSEQPRNADELAPVMKAIAEAIDKIGNEARLVL